MVGVKSVLLAAGLTGLSQAAPTTGPAPRAEELTFVPAIGYGSAPESLLKTAVNAPVPQVKQFTPEEFSTWAANASEVPTMLPGTNGAPEKRGTVILPDERYFQSSSAFPFGSIGRLYMPLGNGVYSWCSGTLVGPRLMAAARHCINPSAQYYQFSPGYKDGNVFPTAYVTSIISLVADTSIGNCDLKNDWALYVLDQPLGTQRGYFNIGNYATDESAVSNQPVLYSAGYPGDLSGGQRLYMTDSRKSSLQLKSSCANGGPIIGDADVMGGMSGGPLWRLLSNVRYTYGTLFGAFIDGNGNELSSIHAHGTQFIQGVNNLNAQYPA